MTKEGQLRVYHIQNGNMAHQIEIESPQQAISLINQWADEDLHNPRIEFNAFGLEEFSEDMLNEDAKSEGWSEWYNNEGQDIMEIMDTLDDMLQ